MRRTITIVEPDADFENRERYFFVKENPFENVWVSWFTRGQNQEKRERV